PVEERMGGGSFLAYYGLCALGGAALSFALAMTFQQVQLVVGASAAVYGVMLAFAWAWPDQPISVFPLPEPIAAKWLVTFAVAISLLLALFAASDGVAHLAHLGGFATGLLYLKVADWRLSPGVPIPKLGPAAQCSSTSCRSSSRCSPRPIPPRPITIISSGTSPCCRATGTTTFSTRRRRTRSG